MDKRIDIGLKSSNAILKINDLFFFIIYILLIFVRLTMLFLLQHLEPFGPNHEGW